MSLSSPTPVEFNKEALVTYVERPGRRYLFHAGEGFRYETLPVGTRVIYPPPPLPPIEDVEAAIEEALEHPLGCDPLSALLRAGMRVTIAFDDLSLPLPPMQRPDIRGRVIEKVLEKLAARGVEDIHLIAALGLHRRMTPAELRHVLGPRVCKAFGPDRLYNHDAEDAEKIVLLGVTSQGEVVELSRRVAESDLLIYVNINLVPMDGGSKSIATGLTTYRTIRANHNTHTLMHSRSYMDPPNSALHRSTDRMQAVVDEHLRVFKIETTLNSHTFPPVLGHLQTPEGAWRPWDRGAAALTRGSLNVLPFEARRSIFHALRAPYGLTGIAAGLNSPVHEHTLANVLRQQAVPVKGQADVVIMGLPYLGPYNVASTLNPVLVHNLALGYFFNLYHGKPLVREGGVLLFMHPLEARFNQVHHPCYVDFYRQVLPQTRDAAEMERRYEESFATNPRYVELYRRSYAYHGAHPFTAWYWACYGQSYLGRVIVVGGRDPEVARTLGYAVAPNLGAALEMAQDTVGPNPKVTVFHLPPIFLCDVE
jgi:hypothetical protein